MTLLKQDPSAQRPCAKTMLGLLIGGDIDSPIWFGIGTRFILLSTGVPRIACSDDLEALGGSHLPSGALVGSLSRIGRQSAEGSASSPRVRARWAEVGNAQHR
jgi:hypothetical protein